MDLYMIGRLIAAHQLRLYPTMFQLGHVTLDCLVLAFGLDDRCSFAI